MENLEGMPSVHRLREEIDKKLASALAECQEETAKKIEQMSVQLEKRHEDATFANKESQCQAEETIEKLQAQVGAMERQIDALK